MRVSRRLSSALRPGSRILHPLLPSDQIKHYTLVTLFFRRLSQRPTAEELEQRNILQRE